jgi:hypothetical protein
VPLWPTITVPREGENPKSPVGVREDVSVIIPGLDAYRIRDITIPPAATGWKSGFASQLATETMVNTMEVHERMTHDTPPQVQFPVVEGLQYAALAKFVNGANASICVELSVVIA